MSMILSTNRAELRPLAAADTGELHALWTHPDVGRYLFDGVQPPPEQTASLVAESERLFATEGLGLWAARDRADSSLAGVAGFWFFRDPPELELLYVVERGRWARGWATEIARGVIEHGSSSLGFQSIRASTNAPNNASIRVLEKLGFAVRRRATVGGIDTLFFELTRNVTPNRLSRARGK